MHERVTSTSGCARRRDGGIWGRRISPLIRWGPGSSPLANTSRLSVATKRQLTMHELQAPFEGKRFAGTLAARRAAGRSEEHTSELQSHLNLVCRLLLEKKKKYNNRREVLRDNEQ